MPESQQRKAWDSRFSAIGRDLYNKKRQAKLKDAPPAATPAATTAAMPAATPAIDPTCPTR